MTRKASEDVGDHVSVCVEFRSMAADVFLAGVSEELQLGVIGPDDSTIFGDPMERNRSILKEIDHFLLQLLTTRVSIPGGDLTD